MEAHKEDTLTPEEIQMLKEMLRKEQRREQKTATSSKESFMKWICTINVLWSLSEKIKPFPWKQILSYFMDLFP